MLAHVSEMNSHGYERVKQLLTDSEKTPRELAILGRHLNIVRANNSAMGSPANRIGIMADAAAAGSSSATGSLWDPGLWLFRWRLALISLAYNVTQARRWVLVNVFRSKAAGFEELLQRQMESEMEGKLGLKLNMQQDEMWENVAG